MKNENKSGNYVKSVTHIGLKHVAEDSRVFYRECVSLAKPYVVNLVCVGSETKEFTKDGVNVIQMKDRSFLVLLLQTFFRAIRLPCDVYHAHDVESLIASFLLKLFIFSISGTFSFS